MSKDEAKKTDENSKPITDEEAKDAVGGASFTQAQFDRWHRMGPVRRTSENFGPGAGE